MIDRDEGRNILLDRANRSRSIAAKQKSTPFQAKTIASSGRAIDDIPLPQGALGLPEVVFEDLIDEEVIKDLVQQARKSVSE